MLGNPNWFRRRKYTGWGITPATWQGWLYVIGCLSLIIIVFGAMHWLDIRLEYSIAASAFLLALIVVDGTLIMCRLNKDEREWQHEAIAERNAAWSMVVVLGIGLLFQVIVGLINQHFIIDPFLIVALFIGALSKGLTNRYLADK